MRPTIPPPQPVEHLSTLWWWLGLGACVLILQLALRWSMPAAAPPAAAATPAPRTEAFLAFVFGKVAIDEPDAMDPAVFRAQLQRLVEEHGHPIRLEDLPDFLEHGKPLPSRPVLIAFDEVARKTMETVDPILAELGVPATAFVSVAGLDAGNINLVSRRRLEQMMLSGRWSVGVSACQAPAEEPDADDLRQRAGALHAWSERPVLAIACWRGLDPGAAAGWTQTLRAAGIPYGFVPHAAGTNRSDDPHAQLKLIRIAADEHDADALVRRVVALTPRDEPFADEFDGEALDGGWIASSAHARIKDGKLRLSAGANDTGGTLTLGGSERWRDARVEVELERAPQGQFWIYARRGSQQSFLRLGVVGNRVVLQKAEAGGPTRQLAAGEAPQGPLRLGLTVVGSRAMATLDGEPLLERPAELPADLAEGPVSMVAWDAQVPAAAALRRVELEPLQRRIALLPAQPDAAAFDRLRREAGTLWAASPRLYRWRDGAASEAAPDLALEILVRHHRIALLPAVSLTELPSGGDWERFTAQLLQWVEAPRIAGLNLVLDRVADEDLPRLQVLRSLFAAMDKELAVTAPDDTGDLPMPPEVTWFAGNGSASVLVAASSRRRSG